MQNPVPLPLYPVLRILLTPFVVITLLGCDDPRGREIVDPVEKADPAGAAAALSIGGEIDRSAASPYEAAIGCVGALKGINERLLSSIGNGNPEVTRAIDGAIEHYRQLAEVALAEQGGRVEPQADKDVEDDEVITIEDRNRSTQLAVACLRTLAAQEG